MSLSSFGGGGTQKDFQFERMDGYNVEMKTQYKHIKYFISRAGRDKYNLYPGEKQQVERAVEAEYLQFLTQNCNFEKRTRQTALTKASSTRQTEDIKSRHSLPHCKELEEKFEGGKSGRTRASQAQEFDS
jgi:Domain of unknown function (DUF1977)